VVAAPHAGWQPHMGNWGLERRSAEKKGGTMKDQPKKPYVKPEVMQVPLRSEEAVLGNCKIAGISGPVSTSCDSTHCMTLGS